MNKLFMTETAIHALLDGMARDLSRRIAEQGVDAPLMVGIHTGGVWIARELARRLALAMETPLGELDISFYRDDFTQIGMNPQVKPSHLPVDLDGRNIILVDDVLHTGRTIRAALNELFDYGRPRSVMLAVLISRAGRQLPIQADISGLEPAIDPQDHIILKGPDTLELYLGEPGAKDRAE